MKVKSKAILGQISDMDLRLLQVFKAVVDCGGFTAAELELNIGISTISRHVKDLETRLGLTLCQRGRAGFMMTPEGQSLYSQTTLLLSAMDAFRAGVDDIHARMGGELHIAWFEKTASNPSANLAQALAAFTEQAPEVRLNLHVRPINEIERGVMDGHYQIGIVPDHRPSKRLRYDPLFSEQMQLYCGTQHPLIGWDQTRLNWKDLGQFALAGLAYHSPNMQMSHRTGLRRQANAFDQEGLAALILSNRFIGFLPTHYAEPFIDRGKMIAIEPSRFNYEARFFSIVRRSPQPSRAAELFRHCLVKAHQPLDV